MAYEPQRPDPQRPRPDGRDFGPDINRPDINRPDMDRPDIDGPDSVDPGIRPDSNRPDLQRPDINPATARPVARPDGTPRVDGRRVNDTTVQSTTPRTETTGSWNTSNPDGEAGDTRPARGGMSEASTIAFVIGALVVVVAAAVFVFAGDNLTSGDATTPAIQQDTNPDTPDAPRTTPPTNPPTNPATP